MALVKSFQDHDWYSARDVTKAGKALGRLF